MLKPEFYPHVHYWMEIPLDLKLSKIPLVQKDVFGQILVYLGLKILALMSKKINITNFMKVILTIITIFSISCSPKVTVQQIDRGYHFDYLMRSDRDTLANKMFDHAYFSREASRGGRVIGGGGCGCN